MAGPDLATLNVIANIMTVVVLVQGLAWAVLHAREVVRRRRDALALEAIRIMQNDAVARAMQGVLALPDGCTSAQLAMRGPEAEEQVAIVEYNLDTLGWMVHRRLIPLRDLDDLMGGAVRAAWRRLHVLAEERRTARGSATELEWTQWLAERLEEDPSPAKRVGAHVHYRRWR